MKDNVVLPDSTGFDSSLRYFKELGDQKTNSCYQCQKCTNGCPTTFSMNILPHRIVHLVQLGLIEEAISSDTIWVCASCQTCSTRCPNGVDISRMMDALRKISMREGKVTQKNVPLFHSEFLSSIKRYGRLFEFGMITRYTLKSQGLSGMMKQGTSGMNMILKGKLKFKPPSLRPKKDIITLFKQTDRKEPRK